MAVLGLMGLAASGAAVELRSDALERTVNMGEGPKQVTLLTIYNFELNGETLTGTQKYALADGSFEGAALEFTARRAKP